jgi:hypothetical protein
MFLLKRRKKISLLGYCQKFAGTADSCHLSDCHCIKIIIIRDKSRAITMGSSGVLGDLNMNLLCKAMK